MNPNLQFQQSSQPAHYFMPAFNTPAMPIEYQQQRVVQHQPPASHQLPPNPNVLPLVERTFEATNQDSVSMKEQLEAKEKECNELIAAMTEQLEENEKLAEQLHDEQKQCQELMARLELAEQLNECRARVPKKVTADACTETEPIADEEECIDEDTDVNVETIKRMAAINLEVETRVREITEQKERELANYITELNTAKCQLKSLYNENAKLKREFVDIRRLQGSWDNMNRERNNAQRKLKNSIKAIKILENKCMQLEQENASLKNNANVAVPLTAVVPKADKPTKIRTLSLKLTTNGGNEKQIIQDTVTKMRNDEKKHEDSKKRERPAKRTNSDTVAMQHLMQTLERATINSSTMDSQPCSSSAVPSSTSTGISKWKHA